MLAAMNWLAIPSLVALVALAAAAILGRLRGRRFVFIPPSRRDQPDQPHRQAIQHFASGVLPPWR